MKMCCYFSTLSNFKRAIIGFRVKLFITVQSFVDSSLVLICLSSVASENKNEK
jgi:hypothetical protein